MKITLLNYLMKTRKESKNVLKTMIQNGSILVNGIPITKANFLVDENVTIEIKKKPILYNNYEIPILYEDRYFLAIDKPVGLLSIATDHEKEETAYHIVSIYLKKKNHGRIFVLHRLDQETSGVLLFAKNEYVKKNMQEHWNSSVKKRGYYALVEGTNLPKKGMIQSWLAETKTHIVYSNTNQNGKKAITHYEVLKEYLNATLLDIHLETGRKNQIRVHMKEMGHPILGDSKYGNKKTFSRLALHAYQLTFLHPITHQEISIKAELPNEFLKFDV